MLGSLTNDDLHNLENFVKGEFYFELIPKNTTNYRDFYGLYHAENHRKSFEFTDGDIKILTTIKSYVNSGYSEFWNKTLKKRATIHTDQNKNTPEPLASNNNVVLNADEDNNTRERVVTNENIFINTEAKNVFQLLKSQQKSVPNDLKELIDSCGVQVVSGCKCLYAEIMCPVCDKTIRINKIRSWNVFNFFRHFKKHCKR